MSKTVSLYLNSKEEAILTGLAEKKKYPSLYACIKGELCTVKEPEKKTDLEQELKTMSMADLKKKFNELTDKDKDQLRELKNSAFFYDRFYNLIHILHNHKAPIDEFLQFTIKFKKLSMVVNEMQRRMGEEALSWDDNHRLAASIWPKDYKTKQMWREMR